MIPWPVLFLGMLFNNLFYWCTNQSIIQRTLAAKNLAQAQRGAVFTAFLKLLDPFFITIWSAGLPLLRRRPGKQRPGIPVSDHHGCSELAARHHRSGSVRCDPVVL